MAVFPSPHIIAPRISHSSTIILLHGRGSNGQEFSEELFEAQASDGRILPVIFPGARWVFPTSRERHSTVFQEKMTEWFDVHSLTDPEERQDLQVDGLKESVAYAVSLVDQEIKLVGGEPSRLILGGVSQGCAVAIHALLAGRHKLGAFIGFCAWLPFSSQLEKLTNNETFNELETTLQWRLSEYYESTLQLESSVQFEVSPNDLVSIKKPSASNLDTPLFISHCKDDDMVNVELGRQLCNVIRKFGTNVTWDEHDKGGHWIHGPDGIDHLLAFIFSHQHALQPTVQETLESDSKTQIEPGSKSPIYEAHSNDISQRDNN